MNKLYEAVKKTLKEKRNINEYYTEEPEWDCNVFSFKKINYNEKIIRDTDDDVFDSEKISRFILKQINAQNSTMIPGGVKDCIYFVPKGKFGTELTKKAKSLRKDKDIIELFLDMAAQATPAFDYDIDDRGCTLYIRPTEDLNLYTYVLTVHCLNGDEFDPIYRYSLWGFFDRDGTTERILDDAKRAKLIAFGNNENL